MSAVNTEPIPQEKKKKGWWGRNKNKVKIWSGRLMSCLTLTGVVVSSAGIAIPVIAIVPSAILSVLVPFLIKFGPQTIEEIIAFLKMNSKNCDENTITEMESVISSLRPLTNTTRSMVSQVESNREESPLPTTRREVKMYWNDKTEALEYHYTE